MISLGVGLMVWAMTTGSGAKFSLGRFDRVSAVLSIGFVKSILRLEAAIALFRERRLISRLTDIERKYE
ncbi:hypothetical protein LBWT_24450 [Leptolyngbya boryana IAM M-101]|nr:hypothetical protein LBWT_24450 [Leptolyngbya boryana IAM M-101]BAS62871.1 hypothetical protein LBDG_24450 [Leptolyngbya boryana dg5]